MIGDKDIQRIKEGLATKEDLEEVQKEFQTSDNKLLDEIFYTERFRKF